MYKNILRVIVFLFLLFPFFQADVYASEFPTVYNAEYSPSLTGPTKVILDIYIKTPDNLTYIQEYTLSFPSSFDVKNLKATQNALPIPASLTARGQRSIIKVSFPTPEEPPAKAGVDFRLEFTQSNIFNSEGQIWEVILPTLGGEYNTTYNITLKLPDTAANKFLTESKISIAKPKPTLITQNKIYWENVRSKTIYAVFGTSQFYKLDLKYNLENTEDEAVYYEVAFPPETQYQKIVVESINPPPDNIYIDEDGNFIGRYNFEKREKKAIFFSGFAEVLTTDDEDLNQFVLSRFMNQKKYLLTEQKYWKLGEFLEDPRFTNIRTPLDVYNFTTAALSYNYDKLGAKNVRLGADKALKQPNFAVCMEFTDLFIALAREKGIYAREHEGFAFSNDEVIRPRSLVTDVLHSWPEYYEEESGKWIAVDPTWENTSGIDYFNSLDLNHLTFSIHGRDSTYPYAAGMYKVNPKSKDVSVNIIDKMPEKIKKVDITNDMKTSLIANKKYSGKITITNRSNHFLKNSSFLVKSDGVDVVPKSVDFDLLAPMEKKTVNVEYSLDQNISGKKTIFFVFDDEVLSSKVVSPAFFTIEFFVIFLGGIAGSVALFFYVRKRRNKQT